MNVSRNLDTLCLMGIINTDTYLEQEVIICLFFNELIDLSFCGISLAPYGHDK